MKRSNRRGERASHTVPVSSWLAAKDLLPTLIRMVECSWMLFSRDTTGTPKPASIFHRLECPAELNAFLKSRSTQMSLVSCFMARFKSQRSF